MPKYIPASLCITKCLSGTNEGYVSCVAAAPGEYSASASGPVDDVSEASRTQQVRENVISVITSSVLKARGEPLICSLELVNAGFEDNRSPQTRDNAGPRTRSIGQTNGRLFAPHVKSHTLNLHLSFGIFTLLLLPAGLPRKWLYQTTLRFLLVPLTSGV